MSRFVLLLAAALALMPAIRAQEEGEADGVAELVAALATTPGEPTLTALVMAGEEAVPPLGACVRTAPDEHAWQAVWALRRIAAKASRKSELLTAEVPLLAAELARADATEPRRVLAALGLAALGPRAEGAAGALARTLESADSPALRAACAIALGSLEKEGVAELKKGLGAAGVTTPSFFLIAAGLAGRGFSDLKRDVAKIVTKDEDFAAFLLSRAAFETLVHGGQGRAARTAWAKRVKMDEGRVWRGGSRINVGGIVPNDPTMFVFLLVQELKLEVPPEVTSPNSPMSLPTALGAPTNGNEYLSVADGQAMLTAHFVARWLEVGAALGAGDIETWRDWRVRTFGLDLLARFLGQLASRSGD